jgi:hypothetical protein
MIRVKVNVKIIIRVKVKVKTMIRVKVRVRVGSGSGSWSGLGLPRTVMFKLALETVFNVVTFKVLKTVPIAYNGKYIRSNLDFSLNWYYELISFSLLINLLNGKQRRYRPSL